MNRPIGTSEVRLVSADAGPTAFGKFVVDAFRESSGADFAIDVGAFHGNTPQAAGAITRLNLMQMYPRKLEVTENQGLSVYEGSLPGIAVTVGLKYALRFGFFLSTSGISYDTQKLSDVAFASLKAKYAGTADADSVTPYYPTNIKINERSVKALYWYRFAAPEFVIRGAFGITPLAHLIIRGAHPTPVTIWDSMQSYLAKVGVIKRMNANEAHFTTRIASNAYRRRFNGKQDGEQINGGESLEVPYINESSSLESVFKKSLTEILSDPEGKSLNEIR